jgi:hypothetical protein
MFNDGSGRPSNIYGLHVILPRDMTDLDDSIFDSIDILNTGGYISFERFGGTLTPIKVKITPARLASFRFKGICFGFLCENGIPDELFSGWDTLEFLWLGASTGPGIMQEYPVNLANHKNLKYLNVNGWGVYYGGPGFESFVKDFRDRHPEPGSFTYYV